MEMFSTMETIVNCLLMMIAALLATSVGVFSLEVVAAIALPQRPCTRLPNRGPRPRLAALVPAHNESTGVLPTLADIQSQLLSGDRLLVVADNCTDDTAAVAAARGVEVIERHDATRIGKGYALEWGVRHLSLDAPEIVVVIDADCRLADDSMERLAFSCKSTGRPTQALNLMTGPKSKINYQVAEFAWRVKNWIRPLGLTAVDLPCQLMGTGMAFPWSVIRSANLGNGRVVEDLILGLDLTLAGHPPLFCPSARVMSEFPTSVKGAKTQRQRWEHGHIDTIRRTAPRLLIDALTRRNWDLLALALDLSVPPLSLLGILILGMIGVSGLVASLGFSSVALVVSIASLFAFAIATFLAWFKCGRDVLPVGAILWTIPYIIGKLTLYSELVLGKISSEWIRTDRRKSE